MLHEELASASLTTKWERLDWAYFTGKTAVTDEHLGRWTDWGKRMYTFETEGVYNIDLDYVDEFEDHDSDPISYNYVTLRLVDEEGNEYGSQVDVAAWSKAYLEGMSDAQGKYNVKLKVTITKL